MRCASPRRSRWCTAIPWCTTTCRRWTTDDLRRGKPTVHRKFDEATAILAGDGLLTEAFAILSEPDTHKDAQVRGELTRPGRAAGGRGMVGGQQVDMSDARNDLDLDQITELQRMKTGALIEFACEAGAILGGADSANPGHALRGYARDLGLAFQIADDLLDVEASTEQAGKPTGQGRGRRQGDLRRPDGSETRARAREAGRFRLRPPGPLRQRPICCGTRRSFVVNRNHSLRRRGRPAARPDVREGEPFA